MKSFKGLSVCKALVQWFLRRAYLEPPDCPGLHQKDACNGLCHGFEQREESQEGYLEEEGDQYSPKLLCWRRANLPSIILYLVQFGTKK